ncbi:unnamed protein product, partial [Mesorhabditis spiculigera]
MLPVQKRMPSWDVAEEFMQQNPEGFHMSPKLMEKMKIYDQKVACMEMFQAAGTLGESDMMQFDMVSALKLELVMAMEAANRPSLAGLRLMDVFYLSSMRLPLDLQGAVANIISVASGSQNSLGSDGELPDLRQDPPEDPAAPVSPFGRAYPAFPRTMQHLIPLQESWRLAKQTFEHECKILNRKRHYGLDDETFVKLFFACAGCNAKGTACDPCHGCPVTSMLRCPKCVHGAGLFGVPPVLLFP